MICSSRNEISEKNKESEEMKIDSDKLFQKLFQLEKRHRDLAEKPGVHDQYQVGFADGVQEAMNQITGILDEIRRAEER